MLLHASETTGGPSHPFKVGDQWARGIRDSKNPFQKVPEKDERMTVESKKSCNRIYPFRPEGQASFSA